MKKIIYLYFYQFGIRGQGEIDSLDIIIGLILSPIAFPLHLIKTYLKGKQ